MLKFQGLNIQKILSNCEKSMNNAQKVLDIQVAKDCDPYVPFNEGNLRASVFRSHFGSGWLTYDVPYAKHIYNSTGYIFNKTKHPLAQDHWFETVKGLKINSWRDVYINALKKV